MARRAGPCPTSGSPTRSPDHPVLDYPARHPRGGTARPWRARRPPSPSGGQASPRAGVAEQVDAADLNSVAPRGVRVRISAPAPLHMRSVGESRCCLRRRRSCMMARPPGDRAHVVCRRPSDWQGRGHTRSTATPRGGSRLGHRGRRHHRGGRGPPRVAARSGHVRRSYPRPLGALWRARDRDLAERPQRPGDGTEPPGSAGRTRSIFRSLLGPRNRRRRLFRATKSYIVGSTLPQLCSLPFVDFVHPGRYRGHHSRDSTAGRFAGEPVAHFQNRFRHQDGLYR